MGPLPGSLHAEYKRCGRPACRCTQAGGLHGPYWVRRWREGGRLRRQYVPAEEVPDVAAAVASHHELHPPAWTMRQVLVGLRRMTIQEGQ